MQPGNLWEKKRDEKYEKKNILEILRIFNQQENYFIHCKK